MYGSLDYSGLNTYCVFPDLNRRCSKEESMSILVAYDGSEVARDALMLARRHAQAYGENLEVVRSVERGGNQ